MSAQRPPPPPRRASPRLVLGLLLALGAGVGCVRTTSIGRAGGATDAQAERGTDAAAERDATPAADQRVDTPPDTGPIVGGGRDAADDALDGADAPDDALDGSDAADGADGP